jgi:excisionase family DNA binding protein
MNSQLPRLLTIGEVANCLRMSKSQVYIMVAKKKLPYIRLSERRIVVSEEDLVAFIQRQRAMEPSQLVFMLDRILEKQE